MNGRSPAEAVAHFATLLQLCVSCISDGVVHPREHDRAATVRWLSLGSRGTRLRGEGPATLELDQYFVAEPSPSEGHRWRVRTVGYTYALLRDDGREILAYHWHPDGRSHVTTPHLHLSAGAEVGWPGLQKTHLPTGQVLLTDLIELAIGCGVRPRRADWRSVVDGVRDGLTAE